MEEGSSSSSSSSSSSKKQVMVVGVEHSDYSTYALEWALDHLIAPSASNPIFKLVIVYAKPNPASSMGFAGPGVSEVLPVVEADFKRTATRITDKAKELCTKKSVNDPIVEVMDGDPRSVLCEAVERHQASILVVGDHGYGPIKRAVLGSVSDYCAHNAHCTVMIVKKPKIKH